MKIFSPHLDAPSELEKKTLEKNQAQPGERLSCQVTLVENAMAETSYW
jgi:ferredoxin